MKSDKFMKQYSSLLQCGHMEHH